MQSSPPLPAVPLFDKVLVCTIFKHYAGLVLNENAHTRSSVWALWVIRHLVEPFKRIFQKRLGPAQSAHRMMVEQSVDAKHFNLYGDGWQGKAALFGVVDVIMYPGTQAFMRWDMPSSLHVDIQQRALQIAQAFLSDIDFDLGIFKMAFFYDDATDRVTFIEFSPRVALQFSDLYSLVTGLTCMPAR